MSYVCALFHVVFSTYHRQAVLNPDHTDKLYAVIASEIKFMNCKPLLINGVHDHIHILLGLHQNVALANLVRIIKSKSSVWAKSSGFFPMFKGWEKEYGAFSVSNTHTDAVYKYIERQKSHHSLTSFNDEYKRLIIKAGLKYYDSDGD